MVILKSKIYSLAAPFCCAGMIAEHRCCLSWSPGSADVFWADGWLEALCHEVLCELCCGAPLVPRRHRSRPPPPSVLKRIPGPVSNFDHNLSSLESTRGMVAWGCVKPCFRTVGKGSKMCILVSGFAKRSADVQQQLSGFFLVGRKFCDTKSTGKRLVTVGDLDQTLMNLDKNAIFATFENTHTCSQLSRTRASIEARQP